MSSSASKLLSLPPPNGVIPNWLGTEMVARLIEYARQNPQLFKASNVGYGDNSKVNTERRRSVKLRDFGALKDEIEIKTITVLSSIFEKLGSPIFVPSRIELELVAHQDGAFFAMHKDTFKHANGAPSSRVISAVYYFHSAPRAFTGGILRLHSLGSSGKEGSYVDIEPVNDTLVFFPSWFPHEVLPVSVPSGRFEDSRFAINCWIHRE